MTIITDFQKLAQASIVLFGYASDDKPIYGLRNGVDCEYNLVINHPNRYITTQKAICHNGEYYATLLEDPRLGLNLEPIWDGRCAASTFYGFKEVDIVNGEFTGYFLDDLVIYHAPGDALGSYFRDLDVCREIQSHCTQFARLKIDKAYHQGKKFLKGGNVHDLDIYYETQWGILKHRCKITDVSRVNGIGTLANTLLALGYKSESKHLLDEYKTNMVYAYEHLHDLYVQYSCDDAIANLKILEGTEARNKKLFAVHNLNYERETLTMGSPVAEMAKQYIINYIGKYDPSYHYTSTKPNSNKVIEWDLERLIGINNVGKYAEKEDSNKDILALVQGGRAKNEMPSIIKLAGVIADLDIAGAYVSIQMLLNFPVGLPIVWGKHKSAKKKMTLGQWLSKNQNDLVPRLWQVVVTGELNHHQTLVHSKLINPSEVNKAYDRLNPKINANFRLFTKEIINGIITSDILEVLQNVCTKREFNEWMNLEVIASIHYPKDACYTDPKEWFEAIDKHVKKYGNEVVTKFDKNGIETRRDFRAKKGLLVPLKGFLEPYAKLRKESKKKRNEFVKGSDEYAFYDAEQNSFKLVGNTNYGTEAAPYFVIGCVLLANVITAAVRTVVWSQSIALGAVQSITDGGGYDMNQVRFHQGSYSMNILSCQHDRNLIPRKEDKYAIRTGYLKSNTPWELKLSDKVDIEVGADGKENKEYYSILTNNDGIVFEAKEGGWAEVDKMALDHVREFFHSDENPISILNEVGFEHKDLYASGIFHSQTNYQFKHVSGEIKTKARGHKLKDGAYLGEDANILDLFKQLDIDPTKVPIYKPQFRSQLLKVNEANRMMDSKTDNVYKQNGLLAGDSIAKKSWLRPLSLSPYMFQTRKQYDMWNKKLEQLKNRTGWGLEYYFIEGEYINYERAIKTINQAINNGLNWVIESELYDKRKDSEKEKHPYIDFSYIDALDESEDYEDYDCE